MFFDLNRTIRILTTSYWVIFLGGLVFSNVYYFIVSHYYRRVYFCGSYWRRVAQLKVRVITPQWRASSYAEFFWYLIAMKNTIYTVRTDDRQHRSNFWYISLTPAYLF